MQQGAELEKADNVYGAEKALRAGNFSEQGQCSYGIAGIGKSKIAKAYAKQYKKEYTNIIYIFCSGDLRQDVIDLDFADDRSDESKEKRFYRHNRFFRTLKSDLGKMFSTYFKRKNYQ